MNFNEYLILCEKKIEATMNRIGNAIPYTTDENMKYSVDYSKEDIAWWTNGFWPGILWQFYSKTKDEKYLNTAMAIEEKMDELFNSKFESLYHDVGFMWLHTAVANYRCTINQCSRTRGLHAASVLSGRFNPFGNYLVAWNWGCSENMIVDSLMNIPILFWASKEVDDPRYRNIAIKHAETALKYICREDGSVNHICRFNPDTGEYIGALTGQAYSESSAWSRGLSWAIYGFTILYRETENEKYLKQAKISANYFISNIQRNNYVSNVDFKAPIKGNFLDTSATAITASALLDLKKYVSESEAENYEYVATRMLSSLLENYCNFDTNVDSILQHCSEKYHNDAVSAETDLIYGDYFLIEALMKKTGDVLEIW